MIRTLTFLLMLAVVLICAPSLYAADYDTDYPSDSRIKILQYDGNDIFTIYTLYGYQTNIEFAQSEAVQTISVGDRSLWQIIPSSNRLFIRPMDDNVSTNMTVITNMRTYQFDLKSGEGKLDQNPRVVYVARFTYPDKNKKMVYIPAVQASPITPVRDSRDPYVLANKPLLTPPPAEPLTSIKQPAVEISKNPTYYAVSTPESSPTAPPPDTPKPELVSVLPASAQSVPKLATEPKINRLYTYSGPDALAPNEVYDDGKTTYLRLPNSAELPTAHVITEDGAVTPAMYTVRDGVTIIHSVAARIMLSYPNSSQTVYVYNEAMKPEDSTHGQ